MTYEELHEACSKSFLPLRVAYLPAHADGDINHPSVGWGYVSTLTDNYCFVKFDEQLAVLGWASTQAQGCPIGSIMVA